MFRPSRLRALLVLLPFLWLLPAHAQWISQTNLLKAGWNAVYLHVDATHASIDDLLASDPAIEEVWLWVPAAPQQFIDSPQKPSNTGSQWLRWRRTVTTLPNTLGQLVGNAAYYVKLAAGNANYSWTLRGRPLAPRYEWTSSGLNFVGFPVTSTNVTFEQFLLPYPSLLEVAEIYRSAGGAFGTSNPARLFDFARTSLRRGDAVWMRVASGYNRYFGPFEVTIGSERGINFGAEGTQFSFRVRNTTSATNVITLRLLPSESAPVGQPAIEGLPPLLVRGEPDPATLTYLAESLDGSSSVSWTLPPAGVPGADIQVVVGLERSLMLGAPGALYSGVLQLTDSANLLEVNLGVAAEQGSSAGLWVGEAQVTHVVQYLKVFDRNPTGRPNIRLTEDGGEYQLLYTNEVMAAVSNPFPLRLIVHDDGSNLTLLQRVFVGRDGSNESVIATRQELLAPSRLDAARRISAAHLPWSATNPGWAMTASNGVYRADIVTAYDNTAANPFIHQYHPDHDNLNASFTQVQPKGQESYGISRTIWLSPQPAGFDYYARTSGTLDRKGVYDESLTVEASGANTRTFRAVGTFSLKRISSIQKLTR